MARLYSGLARRRVGLSFRASISSYVALFALEFLESDIFLLNGSLPAEEAVALARSFQLGALISDSFEDDVRNFTVEEFPGEALWSGRPSVTILTSGTTGRPKAARHTWASITRPIRRGGSARTARWLQTYRPHLYAGLQVSLQCFANYGTLCVPQEGWGASDVAKFIADHRVEYISATPSYWRWLLLFSDAMAFENVNLVQITLGGEVVDQSILNLLKARFPNARIAHIYATTELGRCFSVTDGLEGFPRQFLVCSSPDGVELKVQEGELLVRSANSMSGYDPLCHQTAPSDDWIATGDIVKISKERVLFAGRKTDLINVGGNKVQPLEVEQVIRSVKGVLDVRVFGKRSSVSGQLVACEIVSDKTGSDIELREEVQKICRDRLLSHQVPRLIRVVDRIELSAAQKTVRTEGVHG